jgi:hypothetical protein
MEDGKAVRPRQDEARSVDSSPHRREDYEAPKLTVIGPLTKITLGSGGTMNDGINKLKKSG